MLHLSFLPASIFLLSVPFVFCLPSIRLPCLCLFIVALAQVFEYCTLDLPLQTLNPNDAQQCCPGQHDVHNT